MLVDKTFRVFASDRGMLLPPSLNDWLPAEHLARFVADLVDEHLHLARIRAGYTEGSGGPPYDPRLMVRILMYGYATGVRSSRKLEAACVDVVAFRWLAAGSAPDYRRSRDSANATYPPWGTCSCRHWRCARPPAWSS
ncbi:transposase [Mycobacterium camsae]|uniref:transposase n=1 Tax=Mycobacterium gordonae TaxID=1778 RepID=UPI00197CE17B